MDKWSAIRGLLFRGHFLALNRYFRYFSQLNDAVESEPENSFIKESIYSKILREEEKVQFGRHLGVAERTSIEALWGPVPLPAVQGLVLGRYLGPDGCIKCYKFLEWLLVSLTTLTLVLFLIWFTQLAHEVFALPEISAGTKIAFIGTVFIIAGLPAAYFTWFASFPIHSYWKYGRQAQMIIDLQKVAACRGES